MGPATLAALALASAAAGPLDWMAGDWCTQGSPAQTCEHWAPMAGGTMLGTSQTVRDGRTQDFEFMRIVLDDGTAVFHGSPAGGPAIAFRQAERSGRRVAFVNAGHDYPQRIAYWRDGDALIAEIALADGGKARQWRYSPQINGPRIDRPETKD